MTRAGASGARFDDQGAVAARAVAKWLRLAAAPTFAVMALLTVVFDSGLSNALCSAAGGSRRLVRASGQIFLKVLGNAVRRRSMPISSTSR